MPSRPGVVLNTASLRRATSEMLKAVTSRLQTLAGGAADKPASDNTDAPRPPSPDPSTLEEIVEGSARILHPKGAVFYNPAQVVNRDLSVLVLRRHARAQPQPLRILEALSATGLRSIRYFNEVPNVACVLANDLDASAVTTIARTVRHNGLDPESQVVPHHGDASAVMAAAAAQPNPNPFHVIDLDPYGSAAPFVEPALRAATDGALLAVTCTDLAVLCGNSPEKCYARYAATPLKSPTMHEMAVRIVLASIQAAANRLDRAVEPVFCVKIDFYIRLFLRVRDSKSLGQQTPSSTALVFQCAECGTQRFQHMGRVKSIPVSSTPRRKRRRRGTADDGKQAETADKAGQAEASNTAATEAEKPEERTILKFQAPMAVEHISNTCSVCGGSMHIGGPLWTGPLIGEGVADELLKDLSEDSKLLNARDRVQALITLLGEEIRTVPLFMHLPSMCKVLRTSAPPSAAIRSVLIKKGYEVSQSHTDPAAIKTTAPPELVWDILRLWVKKNGSSLLKKMEKKNSDASVANGDSPKRALAGERILMKEPTLITADEIDFSVKKDKFMRRGTPQNQSARFPPNPQPNWGPKARAGKRKMAQEMADEH